ncbi:hypothetical protein FG10452.1 [Paecilomyces variotii No. 5]|uniref:Uncharacterized protein n=1 Tax=Byssochlamys spectabilis (strain No. 5 / NBRC 109023) TaxID=1356009 RepID=V5I1H3_BYSSN|nr:hypothetical protein FG10452.1 [Paecilomyces variotii No. 5]
MDPISTLNREAAKALVKRYGADVLLGGVQLWSHYRSGKASKEQQQAYKAMKESLPKVVDHVKNKEIKVIQGAFNSSAEYIAKFQAVALVSIAIVLLDVDSAIKRIGASLERIGGELEIANAAKIQGWENEGFGAHVYNFVRNEMLQATSRTQKEQAGAMQQHHYFYVWNPDTTWYPVFEERNRVDPLGPNFGGYSHDLATICLRMRIDRETLIEKESHGRTAQFHLLIPAYSPIVIDHPIAFHDSLLPLTITGQRHRQVDCVWLNLRVCQRALNLQFIGVLEQEQNPFIIGGLTSYFTCGFLCFATAAASTAFPPLAPTAGSVIWSLFLGMPASFCTAAGGFIHDIATFENTHILGSVLFFSP